MESRADRLAQAAADRRWLAAGTTRITCGDRVARDVFVAGSGPLLVCVPIVGPLNFLFVPQIHSLCARRRVAIYDPIVSRSAPHPLSERVAELDAVVQALGDRQVDLLGWSDGGIVACAFAARFPSRTRSLALLSLPPRFGPLLRAGARLLASLPLERAPGADLATAWLLAVLASGPVARPREVFAEMRRIPGFLALVKYSLAPLLLDHAIAPSTIAADALVMVGGRDRFVSVSDARALAAMLCRARPPVVIPSGEHFLTYTDADAVNPHLTSFLP